MERPVPGNPLEVLVSPGACQMEGEINTEKKKWRDQFLEVPWRFWSLQVPIVAGKSLLNQAFFHFTLPCSPVHMY